MSMMSEIATEGTVDSIVRELKKKYDHEQNPERKDAFKQAILECFNHFEWSTPDWAKKMEAELKA